LNKAIQAEQAPGSTFKPFVAIAGLETGTVDPSWTTHCTGGVKLYDKYQHCHAVHGTLSMHGAIVNSCDVFFYTLGAKVGIDNIAFYGDIAGCGHKTGIDLPHEREGIMPSEQWKIRTYRQKWYVGETPSVAIGQGALTVTPLQLTRAIGGLAVGGKWFEPHLVARPAGKVKEVDWNLTPEHVKTVVDGMYGVVNEGGTGGRARLPNVEVCGKTGTAQLASYDYINAVGKGVELRENAWFEAFAPRDNPEIVVVAFFEHGRHGPAAAEIVRDVFAAYFDKKARIQTRKQVQAETTARLGLELPGTAPGATSPGTPQPAPQP
ncbi:MAG: penicillin-binding protein 2, partial [Acidobacteriota bacterium]|nr:penicillin-binding protein 2 [Acidobacteriota bacterium]